jgi:hypothetical protein
MNGPRSPWRAGAAAPPIVIAIIAFVLAACSAPGAATPDVTEAPIDSPSAAATPSQEPTPTEEPSEEPSASPGIGTKVNVEDQQYVTVTAVEPWPGNDTQQAAAGNVFVAVNIRIDAITTTSFTSEDFSVEDADGNSYSEAAPGRSPHLSYQDGLTPDTYYAGYVTFEVPEAAAEELILVYAPNFLDSTYEIELF